MPYITKQEGNKVCVYKKDTGEKVGCTTKENINKYLAALHAHEPKNEVNKLKYVKNMSADGIATLFLYDTIGSYWDEETGQVVCKIDGAEFAKTIEYLQSEAKQINVRINSAGGNVLDGYAIFDAIRSSTIPVYTYNVGLCASIASIIFLAGHKRFMYDYSTLMIHNPSLENGEESEILSIIKDQLIRILKNNSILTEEELGGLMDKETYFNAEEAEMHKLIDEKVITDRAIPNVSRTNIAEMANIYNKLILNTDEEMKRKTKAKEEIVEVVNEAVVETVTEVTPEVISEIAVEVKPEIVAEAEIAEEVINKAKNEDESAEPAEEEMTETEEEEEAEDKMSLKDAKKLIAELTQEVEALKSEKAKAKAEKIKNMLDSFVSAKAIEITEVPSLSKLADTDFDAVYNMLSKINTAPAPINKEAVKIYNHKPNVINVLTGKESWTIRDWEKKDPAGLEKIKNESPLTYEDMYRAYYNK